MSVVTSFEETGPCRKKLTIEVPAEAVAAEMGRVVGEFRKSLRMPGFRQGKVPVSVVRSRYQKDIEREVADRLLPRYWHQAQAEKNLDPLLPPSFEDLELEDGKPLTVVVSIETRPEIELGDLSGFDLPEDRTEPTAAEVDDALDDLRRRHAAWVPADRPAAGGDLVVGTVTDTTAGGEEKPMHVEIGAEGIPEELSLALTGRQPGQSVDYRGPVGDAGEEHDLRFAITGIKEQELPELDDDLASKIGGFDTVEELREAVEQNLRGHRERALKMRREKAMLEQLRQRHPLELPAGVVEHESERLLREYAEGMQARGHDLESPGFDWESLAAQVKPEAEKRVHDRLLLDAVGAREELRLDESEFEKFLGALAAQQQTNSMMLRQQLAESGRLEPLRAEMLREQTKRFLLGELPDEKTSTETAEDA